MLGSRSALLAGVLLAGVLLAGSSCATPSDHGPRTEPPRPTLGTERASDAARPSVTAEAVDRLIRDLDHPDCEIRVDAAQRLGEAGPAARAAVPPLIRFLGQATCGDTVPARRALERIGRAAVRPHLPALIDCLASDIEEGRWACGEVLGSLGAEVLPSLEPILDSPSSRRHVAVFVLGRIGRPALPLLWQLAAGRDACGGWPWKRGRRTTGGEQQATQQEQLRSHLAQALAAVGEPALARLAELLSSTETGPRQRECGVWLVGQMAEGPPDGPSRALLVGCRRLLRKVVSDPHPPVRAAAQEALEKIESALASLLPEDEE